MCPEFDGAIGAWKYNDLERVRRAMGSLDVGTQVVMLGGSVVGVAMAVGHGDTSAAVDSPDGDASAVRRALFAWLADVGDDVQIDSPAHDAERLSDLDSLGFAPLRSSLELARFGNVADLPDPTWPDGILRVPFRLGVDDEELHEMVYSFWTDVPGYTYRPIDEWRPSILEARGMTVTWSSSLGATLVVGRSRDAPSLARSRSGSGGCRSSASLKRREASASDARS